jgi:hypothetical protein
MFGQLCELELPVPERAPGAGGVLGRVDVEGAVEVVVVVLVVELAALAIAAPPPTTAPVTASAVSRRLIRPIVHLLSDRCARRCLAAISEV